MTDIKSLLKQAKRRETTEDVCLRGDLVGEQEQLQRQLAQLPKSDKLGGDPERQRITAELERLLAEMRDATVTFTLRALPDADFQRLVDEHPPRRDGDEPNRGDAQAGYNRATFSRALIRACVVDPLLDDEDWHLVFAEALDPLQVTRLYMAAARVNGGNADVPFSPDDLSENPG